MMIWFIRGLGRNRRRLWSARQVTSTRAPPSGMKRIGRLISPSEDGKSAPKLIRPRTAWVCEGVDEPFRYFRTERLMGRLALIQASARGCRCPPSWRIRWHLDLSPLDPPELPIERARGVQSTAGRASLTPGGIQSKLCDMLTTLD